MDSLSAVVQEAMQRLQIPGVAVGVLHNGREEAAGFGVTSVDHPLPVTPDTFFQIGSITKTFTGTLIMRLVEQGRLDLAAPVRTYLPDLRLADDAVAARVTLGHLLSHTGGWVGDYFDDFGPGDDALARYVAEMATLPQLTPLGEIWSYNNAAFAVAGRVIEVVTGQPYEAAARALLLEPLGMARTSFFAADIITERFAVGHTLVGERHQVARPWALARCANPVGGLVSSVRELFAYARFHLGDGTAPDGTRLLSPAAVARMRVPLARAGNMADATGVSWMLRDVGGAQVAEHGGGTNGQTTRFSLVPERDFAVIVLTNDGRGAALHGEICAWAIEHYLGLTNPAPVPHGLPDTELAQYAGRYAATLSDVEISPAADGHLQVQVIPQGRFPLRTSPPGPTPPPARAAFFGQDRLIVLDTYQQGTRAEFLRDADGRVTWLRFGSRIHKRQ